MLYIKHMAHRSADFVAVAFVALTFGHVPLQAQIITDGTVGPATALAGPDFAIGADLGTQTGGNLFHSFQSFSIDTGESATFSGPGSVNNVISRVTGGAVSDIDGMIRSTIPGADVFLINPAGLVFGPNASLDVQGSFHASTADYLGFSDGARYSAVAPAAPILTVAAPESFGFLTSNPASILVDRSDFTLPEGATFSLVGGDVTIQGEGGDFSADPAGSPLTAYEYLIPIVERRVEVFLDLRDLGNQLFDEERKENPNEQIIADIMEQQSILQEEIDTELAPELSKFDRDFVDQEIPKIRSFLRIPSGDVRLISVASPGAVPISGPLDRADFNAFGNVLVDGVFFELSGDADRMTPGGSFYIEGGNVVYKDSHLNSVSYGDLDGGDVTFIANDLTLTATRERLPSLFRYPFATLTSLYTDTGGSGHGGDMTFAADTITFEHAVGVFPNTLGTGSAGDITITGREVTIRHSPSIGSFADSTGDGAGDAGDITVIADSFLIATDGALRVTGLTGETLGAGDAGDIFIQANTVVLDGLDNADRARAAPNAFFKAFMGTTSEEDATGDAGDTTIIADSISILGNAAIVSVTQGAGAGGTITLKARIVEVREGALVISGTAGSADAGNIIIEADLLSLSNDTSPFFSHLSTNTILNTGIIGDPGDPGQAVRGNGGDIILNVGTLELLTGGVVRTTTAAPSVSGNVIITADRVILSGDGTIFPIDEFTQFLPTPGNFTGIVASGVDVTSGPAGDITITAGSIEISGGAVIASTVEGVGSGGAITLNSGVLTITEGARLDAGTFGPGAGGSIFIGSDGTVLLDGSGSGLRIESFSTAPDAGLAGSIFVSAPELRIEDGASISTNSAVADGGNITIDAVELVYVSSSSITTSVGSGFGSGGNIVIADPVFVVLNNAVIEANAFGGPGGNITIVAENFLASPDSIIQASSAQSIDGAVTINAPETDLSGAVAELSEELLDAAERLATQCNARGGRTLATFVGRGRSGLPQQPGDPVVALYAAPGAAELGGKRIAMLPGRLEITCEG